MSNWSRAHDAHLARECEGLETPHEGYVEAYTDQDGIGRDLPHYLTDPAAAIRAAEAWRKGDEGRRRYSIDSPWNTDDLFDASCQCSSMHQHIVRSDTFAAALAQALYRATGGHS